MTSLHRPLPHDPAIRSLGTGCGASLTAIDSTRSPGYQAHLDLVPGLVLIAAKSGARHLTFPGDHGQQAQNPFVVQQNQPDGTSPIVWPKDVASNPGVAPNPACAK